MATKKYKVDGYEIQYEKPYGSGWKAYIWLNGEIIDLAPVSWSSKPHHKYEGGKHYQKVYYTKANLEEMYERAKLKRIFTVVIAVPKSFSADQQLTDIIWDRRHISEAEDAAVPEFKGFACVYEVKATGKQLSYHSIEVEVIRRLRVN